MHASKDIGGLVGPIGEKSGPRAPAKRRRAHALLIVAALAGALMPLVLPVEITRHFEATAVLTVETPQGGLLPIQALSPPLQRALQEPQVKDAIRNRLAEETGGVAAADEPSTIMAADGTADLSILTRLLPQRSDPVSALRVSSGLPGQLLVQARGGEALQAARLANAAASVLALHLVRFEGETAGERVAAARSALQKAQAALEADAVPEADLQAWRAAVSRIAEIDARLRQDRGDLDAARRSLETLKGLTVAGATEAVMPAGVALDAIVPLRQQVLEARLLADRLAADLGPRHPKLIATRAAVDEARGALAAALERERVRWQQEETRLAQDIARLEAEQRQINGRPVSPAVQAYVQKEREVAAARKILAEAAAAEGGTAQSAPIFADLVMPAQAADALASGLPFWLASLMGGLAAFCLAWAALPVRGRGTEQEIEQEIRQAAAAPARGGEPRLVKTDPAPARPSALHPAAPLAALRLAPPPVMAGEEPPLRLPRAGASSASVAHRPEEMRPNVSVDLERELEDLLLSHSQPPDARPLPSLLAAIMSGEAEVTLASPPRATHEDLLQLQADLARLRAEVAALRTERDEGQQSRLRRHG